jgi:hypothetical protein
MTPLHPQSAAWYATQDDDTKYAYDERCAIREAQPDIYTRMTPDQRRKAIERMTYKEMTNAE